MQVYRKKELQLIMDLFAYRGGGCEGMNKGVNE